jgi:hypothetical protein
VTREQVPGCLHGRITTLLENGELERAAGLRLDPAHSRLMMCAKPQLIDDTRALLKQRDLQVSLTRRPGQVAVEDYGLGRLLAMALIRCSQRRLANRRILGMSSVSSRIALPMIVSMMSSMVTRPRQLPNSS